METTPFYQEKTLYSTDEENAFNLKFAINAPLLLKKMLLLDLNDRVDPFVLRETFV